jgi:drug/metabolite transporter (DMT)-like permease
MALPLPTRRNDDPLRGILFQLLAVALFSVSDAMAKLLGQTLPPVEIAWLRYLVFIALTAIPLMRRGGAGLLRSRAPVLQAIRAVGVVGSAVFFILALQQLPLAEATAINFVSPAFITALSIVVLGEVVGWRRWTALAVGLLGVLIVVRPGSEAFQPAALLPVLSAAFWALAAVMTRRMSGIDPPATTLFWTAGIGFLLLSAILPFGAVLPSWREVGLGLLIGLVSSAAQWVVVLAYRIAPASVLAPFSYAQLLTSTALGALVFAAWPDAWTLLGAAVIIGSGLYTAHRERVRARERAAQRGGT